MNDKYQSLSCIPISAIRKELNNKADLKNTPWRGQRTNCRLFNQELKGGSLTGITEVLRSSALKCSQKENLIYSNESSYMQKKRKIM